MISRYSKILVVTCAALAGGGFAGCAAHPQTPQPLGLSPAPQLQLAETVPILRPAAAPLGLGPITSPGIAPPTAKPGDAPIGSELQWVTFAEPGSLAPLQLTAFDDVPAGQLALKLIAVSPAAPVLSALPNPSSPPTREISIDEAVTIALARNPDLSVARGDLAIADSQRVTANTYPFNPTFEAQLQSANNTAGLPQHFRQSYTVLQEIELGHKGNFRRSQAQATIRRTSWEIAQKELDVRADVYRKYQALLMARGKLQLAQDASELNRQLAANARSLLDAGKVTGADLLVAQAEAGDSRQAELIGEVEVAAAEVDLRSSLGIAEGVQLVPQGGLNLPIEMPIAVSAANINANIEDRSASIELLVQSALQTLPEVQAKAAALRQAAAAEQLARANQHANITAGPAIEIDESKTFFAGATIQVPLQIYNRRQGERLQAEAERAKAAADLEQTRLKVKIRILAAYDAYASVQRIAAALANDVLPASQQRLVDADKLLSAGQLDLLKLVELRRRLLAARQQLLESQNQMALRLIELDALTGRLNSSARDMRSAPNELPPPTTSPPMSSSPASRPTVTPTSGSTDDERASSRRMPRQG